MRKKLSFLVGGVAALLILASVVMLAVGLRPFILTSSSMEPTIPKGSLVVVDTKVRDVAIGDVLAYRAPSGDLVLHRLIGQNILKGDNSSAAQEVNVEENLIGRYVWHVPGIGAGLQLVVDHKGVLIGVIVVMIIFSGIPIHKHKSLFKRKKRKHENKTDQNG